MSRGSKFDDQGGDEGLAGLSISTLGPPPGHAKVLPFRRSRSSSASAAGSVPPQSDPAPFESVGSIAQAVIMKLASDKVRLKVQVQTGRTGDDLDLP